MRSSDWSSDVCSSDLQHAATVVQACLSPGQTKATFGTGAFILSASGTTRPTSANRLLATVLVQEGDVRSYALEGSVFVAGSLIKWLRDGLGLLANAGESEGLARSVADNGGVYLVPALRSEEHTLNSSH